MRREYIKEKEYKIVEMWECGWWKHFKTDDKIKNHVRTQFPYKRPLSTDSLLVKIKDGFLFGYVQGDLVVPDELKSNFATFPPIFKNTEVGRNDFGDYMKNHAIENEMLKHPQRMLISSFKLENGTNITPLFIWKLACTAPNFTVLFNALLGNVLIFHFNQWLMRKEKEMKALCREL